MSGEAGWKIDGAYYSVFVGSGVCVSVALPPGDDGSAIGKYFDRENEPYRRWLERAQPGLDLLFDELRASGLPIVPLSEKFEEIDGIVIDEPDTKGEHFRRYSRALPCPVHASGGRRMPNGGSMNLRLLVAERVRRAQVDALADRVVEVLIGTRDDPPSKPEPPPPEPPPTPSRLARARDWLRRRGA